VIIQRFYSALRIVSLVLFSSLWGLNSAFSQSKPQISEAQQMAFDAYFINANKYLMLKMPDEAIKELRQALIINPNHPATNFLLGKIFLDKGALIDAEQYAQKAVLLEDNVWYAKQLAEVYKQEKQYDKAGDVYAGLYRKKNYGITNLFDATYMYVLGKQLNKALKILNEAEKEIGINEDLIKQKQSIYLA
jgi:tetratricopeptide (TPR) repeat protein